MSSRRIQFGLSTLVMLTMGVGCSSSEALTCLGLAPKVYVVRLRPADDGQGARLHMTEVSMDQIAAVNEAAAKASRADTPVPTTQPAMTESVPAGDDDGFPDLPDDELAALDESLSDAVPLVPDPLEKWNRGVHDFNDCFFIVIAKPAVSGYAKLIPEPVRIALRNFFRNLGMPIRLVNCMLQGKWDGAGRELKRFGINTTEGILGFRDVATTKYHVEPANEDLGQTLATWGFRPGCYLVWPFLGPSTVRHTAGELGDHFLNPLRYVEPCPLSLGLSALKATNNATFSIAEYEAIKAEAIDPYVAFRQAYIQYRRKQIAE